MMSNNNNENVAVVNSNVYEVVDSVFYISTKLFDLIENDFIREWYKKYTSEKIKEAVKEYLDDCIYSVEINKLFFSAVNFMYSLSLKDDEYISATLDNLINSMIAESDDKDIEAINQFIDIDAAIKSIKDIIMISIDLVRKSSSIKDWFDRLFCMISTTDEGSEFMRLVNLFINNICEFYKDDIDEMIKENDFPDIDELCEDIISSSNPYKYITEEDDEVTIEMLNKSVISHKETINAFTKGIKKFSAFIL